MTAREPKKAATLSISLTQELHRAIAERVEAGLYTSASELIREALRGLFRQDARELGQEGLLAAARFASSVEMMEDGRRLHAARVLREDPSLSPAAVQEKLNALQAGRDLDTHLRLAPERLERLRRRGGH